MKISQNAWATIGKLGAGAVTLLTIILIVLQISDALKRPDVVAIFHKREGLLSPALRDERRNSVSRKSLLKLIEEGEKKRESPAKILLSVKEQLNKDQTDLDLALMNLDSLTSTAWHVVVTNTSSEVAKDVRLIIPGSGKADISESQLGNFDFNKPPVEWKKEIPLGSIPPNASIQLMIWPEDSLFLTFFGLNAGITHEKGSGVVREAHEFYGWDADLVAWFLGQSWMTRYLLGIVAVATVIALLWYLRRRGIIVFRVTRGADASEASIKDSTT